MPFAKHDRQYAEADWLLMSKAYQQACFQLELNSKTYAHKDRLARHVMTLFNSGHRDIRTLGLAAANRELRALAEVMRQTSGSARLIIPSNDPTAIVRDVPAMVTEPEL